MQRASHALCRMIGPAITPGPCVLVLHLLLAAPGLANSRLNDIADFDGGRDDLLVGYGLVVGLDDTAHSLRNSAFTGESLKPMLERLGVGTRGVNLKTKDVAAVMLTATPPPFARRRRPRVDSICHAAQEFEAIFLAQALGTMTQGPGGDDMLRDGQGAFLCGMLNDEIGKLISRNGGIGVAHAVLREMLKAQEVA